MTGQARNTRDTAMALAGNGPDQTWRTGLRAVLATASLVGAFSFCTPAVDPASAAQADDLRADEDSTQTSDSAPGDDGAAVQAPEHIDVAANGDSAAGPSETPVETSPQPPAEEAFTRLSLDLAPPRILAGGLGGWNSYTLQAPRVRTSAWRSRAEGFVPDWQTPIVRDLSLFVANDDEALSWSFSRASPNYGRVSYQEERVELGKLAAGLALAVDDMQLALAYVEREQPSMLGYTAREDYAGLIWTFRR